MAILSLNDFENFFKYFKGEEQQRAGVKLLYEQMRDVLKDDTHDWVKTYRDKPKVTSSNPLAVPYQSQNDNASGTGYRECFSSSCAMVAMYYGKIKNDDAYNLIREKYGDSTDAQAQVRTLRSLGLEANFISNGSTSDIKAAIDAGRPVPVGWLHHGSSSAPSGGGHYSVVIGYTDKAWVMNDPNGEASLSAGGYTSNTDGSNQSYSFKNWNPRWIVEGEGSGWYMDIRDPGAKK
jgi:hypothetical protein